MQINKPITTEYTSNYEGYIELNTTTDLIQALHHSKSELITLISPLQEEQLNYRYDIGKWTIKEIIIHLIDAERVFTYRALRFARNDKTTLSGFEENDWAVESNASNRTINSILEEYIGVREASISLFKNLSAEATLRSGIANGKLISVRALGFSILGHNLHHLEIIQERYLKK